MIYRTVLNYDVLVNVDGHPLMTALVDFPTIPGYPHGISTGFEHHWFDVRS